MLTKPRSAVIASFVIVLLGLTLMYRLPAPQSGPVSEQAQVEDAARRCNDAGAGNAGRECLKKQLGEWAAKEGVEAAFRKLRSLYQADELTRTNCHQLAHEIGHAGFGLYRDVGVAFTHGDAFCWSGYYHGVLESYVADVGYDRLPESLDGVCSAMPGRERHSFDYYNCVHGIGHGVMAVTGDDLRSSLDLCERLGGQWEKQSCYGGVFMQNNINEHFGDHASDFKMDDPAYPCSVVDRRHKDACYISQTSHMLRAFGGDFSKVFAACAAIPDKEYLETCYQSVGRDASGSSVSDPEKTKATCMRGTDKKQRENCVIGAAKDFIAYFHSDAQAKAFCAILGDASLEETCLATAEQFYVSFR